MIRVVLGMLLASSTFGIPVDEAPRDEALPDPLIQITTLAHNAADFDSASAITADLGTGSKTRGMLSLLAKFKATLPENVCGCSLSRCSLSDLQRHRHRRKVVANGRRELSVLGAQRL